MKYIEFIVNNWTVIVAFICVIILSVQKIIEFISLPTDSRIAEVKACLLEWIRQAEVDLGSGTGQYKLSQVYNKFVKQYPYLKKWLPLEKFNILVKDALKEMENSFANNKVKINALKLKV